MIGISGPSSSTVGVVDAQPQKAAIRCSMVETVTPAALPITVPRRVSTTASPCAGTPVVAVGDVGADEDDAGCRRRAAG